MAEYGINKNTKKTTNILSGTESKGIWRPYFKLIFKTKLPYIWIIGALFVSLFGNALELKFPEYTGQLMGGNLEDKVVYGAIIVLCGSAVITLLTALFQKIVKALVDRNVRKLIWKTLLKHPIPFYDEQKAGEMISRTTTDTSNLSDLVIYIIYEITTLITMGGMVYQLKQYDWRLAVSLLAFIPIEFLTSYILGRANFNVNFIMFNNISKLTQFLSELITNVPLIKIFVNEEKEDKRGKEAINKLYESEMKNKILTMIGMPVLSLMSVFKAIIIFGLGLYFVSKKLVPLNAWVAFYMYSNMMMGMLVMQREIWTVIKKSQGSTARISRLLQEPIEEYNNDGLKVDSIGDISFKNVSFCYGDKKVIDKVSFKIPKGKTTVLVGTSGSGKTTLINLIERFYSPNSGEITMAGVPIEKYALTDWRSNIGYVSQNIMLMSGTIRDNIIYGVDGEVSKEKIIDAAKKANVMEFVKKLPKGLDTEVGELGCHLSGGERQRIAIARAIIRDSKFLILDEVSSNLDADAEYQVQKALENLVKGKTVVTISHKFSYITNSDNIVVIDDGKISGEGSHDELMKKNKVYKKLVEIQSNLSSCEK